MTPGELIAIHMEWRITLRFHASGRQRVPWETMHRIRCENACVIGKWLDSRQMVGLDEDPDVMELDRSHAAFHRQMLLVAECVNSGHYEAAEEMLEPEGGFETASRRLTDAMMAPGLLQVLQL